MPKPKPSAPPDDLRTEFHTNYGSGHDFEAITLTEALVFMGQLTREIVGEEEADAAFSTLTRKLGYDVQVDADWPEVLQDSSFGESYCWPMGARFHDLNAYAYFGIALNGGEDAAEREALLRRDLGAASDFMAKIPFEAWGISAGDAGRTLRRAEGRFALDTGKAIDAGTLAFLGDVTERRIRNMMAGKESVFTVDGEGRIPAEEAIAWLNGRPDKFAPSVWRDQNRFEDLVPKAWEVEDVVFAPVAADNSVFHPGLKREAHYVVGRGAWEEHHESFDAALSALQKMPEPAWLRPTPRGLWTMVVAIRWARQSRAELGRLAETFHSSIQGVVA